MSQSKHTFAGVRTVDDAIRYLERIKRKAGGDVNITYVSPVGYEHDVVLEVIEDGENTFVQIARGIK